MEYNEIQEALQELGSQIGIPDLSFDENGYCCLLFDDIVVNVEADSDSEILFLYSNVGELPPEANAELYEMLLEENFLFRGTGGGALGIDKDTGIIAYAYQIPFDLVSSGNFEQILENFVNLVEDFTQRIEKIIKLSPAKSEKASDVPPPLGMKV
ncbi:MAG: type III secretion system chaperone [Deltaproteobacteria bacterium]|nr:type III secretion system chaperone [Deltaproteobacteria bacterium]